MPLICSFGISPATPLVVQTPLYPNASAKSSLPVTTNTGPVQKMEPLTLIQIAVKNNVGVFYFGMKVPMNVYFSGDGAMGERTVKYIL